MLTGKGFVTDCTTEEFTPDSGEVIYYKRLHVMFEKETGGLGEPIAMTARSTVEFDGMGFYNVIVEPRVRDGKVSWRVAFLDAIQLVAAPSPADAELTAAVSGKVKEAF